MDASIFEIGNSSFNISLGVQGNGGDAFLLAAVGKFLVVRIASDEFELLFSNLIGHVTGQLREDMSGSAFAVLVGLAHSIAEHSSGHLVGVWAGETAVAVGGTSVGAVFAVTALSEEGHAENFDVARIGGVPFSGAASRHKGANSTVLLEGVVDL